VSSSQINFTWLTVTGLTEQLWNVRWTNTPSSIYTPCSKISETIFKVCAQSGHLWPRHKLLKTYQLIMQRKQLIFQLKHQLSSCQHSGRLTVRIWIWLIIKYGQYFRSKGLMWRSTMLMSCTSISRLYGMNLTSVLLTRWSSSGAPNASSYKSLRWGQRWPLWAQTLKTSSEWSSPRMFHIL